MMKLLKKSRIMKSLFKLICFFLVCKNISAQEFRYKAKLNPVNEAGLHRLLLSERIREYSRPGLDDLRLLDSMDREVPYALVYESPVKASADFTELQMVKKNQVNGKFTSCVFENKESAAINNMTVYIFNTGINKTFSLSGSDDMNQWYAITGPETLSDIYSESETSVHKTVYFPLVSYRYLRLWFDDSTSQPVKILKAGIYKGTVREGKLNEITPASVNRDIDKQRKVSLIHIKLNQLTQIDQLDFAIGAPGFYRRTVHLVVNTTKKIKGKEEPSRETLFSFVIRSDEPSQIDLPTVWVKDFDLEFDDNDNPPLEIKGLKFLQWAVYLVADLKANEKYMLATGNDKLQPPVYDLVYFTEKVNGKMPYATLSATDTVIEAKEPPTKAKSSWQQPWFLWTCIGAGILVLALFSYKLIRDMQNG
jgi:hypothetical protein